MSWYTGSHASTAAGQGLLLWDSYVVLNEHWTVHDAAAAENAKVYKCEDAAEHCLFYVYVKDNNTGYWEIELWEGWNAATHAGTGASIAVSSSTYTFRARRPLGGWALAVSDHRVIYIDLTNWQGQYIGQPNRYDITKNIVLIIGGTTGTTYYNCLSYVANSTNGASRFLFDETAGASLVQMSGGASNSTFQQAMGIDGIIRLPGEVPISGQASGLCVGTLEGVADLGAGTSLNFGPARGETVEIDGVDWMIFSGSYATTVWCAVRKS